MGLVGINTKKFENDVSNILVGFPDPERHIPDPSIGGGKPSNKPWVTIPQAESKPLPS